MSESRCFCSPNYSKFDCDSCRVRFKCWTGNSYVQMRCPHCLSIFPLTESQATNNLKFKCPRCHKYNDGCASEENGILIGEVLSKGQYY